MKHGLTKGRSNITYQNKLTRLKKWHAKREKDYALAIKEGKKMEEIKPLEFYVEKLKKPNANEKRKTTVAKPVKPKGGWW